MTAPEYIQLKAYARQDGFFLALLWTASSRKTGVERWRFPRDVAWALLNSREFLFQH